MIKSEPTIQNVSMTTANTEYSYSLPEGTNTFKVQLRSFAAALQLCFIENDSATTYVNIGAGGFYLEEDIKAQNIDLFFRSPTANQTLEVLSWK